MFTFYFDQKPLSVYVCVDEIEEVYNFFFDYKELREFTSADYRSNKARNMIIKISSEYAKKRFVTVDETLVYFGAFNNTENIINFILTDVYDVLYDYKNSVSTESF
ncbi:Hypothetical protein Trvi_ORF26 [Trabala vishnou gigantina nucleopolyhedrovirus]|uniref:Hypothetical protein n=1 Tax=Trabala vishnou gigantina nucleopolyhedrovirus TaxID=2863583 RepID=UPI002481C587|nr:Hypothetical protein QKU87_gp026 [Trabala vishnou gigantina nucleopolyhedrovirus]QYC92772.1 Hypothetical protein Trvi_ORF26 [Trabala vishnou gigantina nucleopolyhedrovirus]